jgi:hypothetical protein
MQKIARLCSKERTTCGFVLSRTPVGSQYYTDYWGAYTRHLDPEEDTPGKRNTQKIERKHLTLRTRIKRWVRKTLCKTRNQLAPKPWDTQRLLGLSLALLLGLCYARRQLRGRP